MDTISSKIRNATLTGKQRDIVMNIQTARFCALLSLGLAGCTTFEIEGNGAITPQATTNSETVHGSLYGYRWRSFDVEKCGTDSLFRVEFHTNVGFLALSTLSLGLYVPQTVEWWCYTPAALAEEEEIWVPPTE